MTLKGNQAIRFEKVGEASQTTHTLNFPVTDIRPRRRKRRYWQQSKAGRDNFIFTLGDGVKELTVSIRFDDKPAELLDLLEAGGDGKEVTLDTDTTDGSTSTLHPSRILLDDDTLTISGDRDRFGKGEYEARFTLRAVGGADYRDIFTT